MNEKKKSIGIRVPDNKIAQALRTLPYYHCFNHRSHPAVAEVAASYTLPAVIENLVGSGSAEKFG